MNESRNANVQSAEALTAGDVGEGAAEEAFPYAGCSEKDHVLLRSDPAACARMRAHARAAHDASSSASTFAEDSEGFLVDGTRRRAWLLPSVPDDASLVQHRPVVERWPFGERTVQSGKA